MKYLSQKLNTKDDSFSYTLVGQDELIFKVDNNGHLYKHGEHIGKFHLAEEQEWQLWIDGKIIASSGKGRLFYLPEFELESLNDLINKV